jgi:hypothetical protein
MPPADPAKPAPNRIRAIIIAVGIGGLLFVVGQKYAWSRLDMTVSKPKLVDGQIQGSFRLKHQLNGILSKGVGGACLIGDFAHLLTATDAATKGVVKVACTDRMQCNPNLPTGPGQKPGPMNPQKWEGYCVPDKNGQGKCWYKPWDDLSDGLLCNTSGMNPGGTPWQVGIDHPTPKDNGFSVQNFYNQYTGGRPAQWRVSGRLFSTDLKTQSNVFGNPECIAPGNKKKC